MSRTAELPRVLSLSDATAVVAGIMIGSGIFLVPNTVAQQLPSTGWILAVWTVCGLHSLLGALAYAELGAMLPATGGQYVFLREAYGPLWAFLCGWSFFLVVQTGSLATLAVGFSIYFGHFVPLPPVLSKLPALVAIALLTWVNCRGVRLGAAVQKVFTVLKVAGLAALIVIPWLAGTPEAAQKPAGEGFAWSGFGVAMIACLWTYKGWQTLSFVTGEIREPQKNVQRALVLGVSLVTVLYLLANFAYLRVLPIEEIARTPRVAAAAAARAIGPAGASLVSLIIVLSIFGTINGNLLASPRMYFAQARDGLFFRRLAEVHPRFRTPHVALIVQGVWGGLLALVASYSSLFSYVIFAAFIFYGMTVVGVIVLRRKRPELARPYRMWGYPATPLLFAAVTLWFVVNTILTTPVPSLIGLLFISTGVPAYYLWRRSAAGSGPSCESLAASSEAGD